MKQRDEKTDEAIVEIKRALEVKKDSVDLLGFLASLYREKKDDARGASPCSSETVELEPNNDKLWFTLGAVYDESKQKEEAIDAMEKAIELNPKNAAALNYLGYTWAEIGVRSRQGGEADPSGDRDRAERRLLSRLASRGSTTSAATSRRRSSSSSTRSSSPARIRP